MMVVRLFIPLELVPNGRWPWPRGVSRNTGVAALYSVRLNWVKRLLPYENWQMPRGLSSNKGVAALYSVGRLLPSENLANAKSTGY